MQIRRPMIPERTETETSLEEVLSAAVPCEEAVDSCTFEGGSAAGEQLNGAEFRGCRFVRCSFSGTQMNRAWFRDVILESCDFSGAILTDATFQRVRFHNCRLTGTVFSGAFWEDAEISDCTAQGAVLSGGAFRRTGLYRSDFSGSGLAEIKKRGPFELDECNFTGAQFQHTSLEGQNLTDCDISGICFTGAELRGARVTPLQACELARLLGVIIE